MSHITVPCLSISIEVTKQAGDLTSQYNSENSPLTQDSFPVARVTPNSLLSTLRYLYDKTLPS